MKGFDGVLISVVAIIATILLGSTVGALTADTVETTKYTYEANINGIFDSSEIPVPTPYSPAGNVNSWASTSANVGVITGGIDFSTLDRYNGIPILKAGQTTSKSGDIPTLFDLPVPPATSANMNSYRWIFINEGVEREGRYACNFSDFKDWLLGGTLGQTYDRWRMPTPNVGIAKITDFEVKVYADDREELTYTGTTPAAVEFGNINDTVSLFDSGGNLMGTVAASELVMAYGAGESTDVTWFTGAYSATGSKTQATEFIDTTKGVTVTGSPSYWGNGFETCKISFVWKSGTTTFTIPLKGILDDGTAGSATLTLSASGGDVGATWTHSGVTTSCNLGSWPAGYINIDLYNGKIMAAGVDIFKDFRDFDLSGVTQDYNIAAKMCYFTEMTASGNATFAIDETSVVLTASETVMIDPIVNIGEHFPQFSDAWRVTYDTIAIYGNSITINGKNYTISDKMMLDAPYDYNGEIAYQDVELSGISITNFGGKTTIKYSNGEKFESETTSTAMSFGGIWYFDADLYSVALGTEEVFSYSGGFGLDATGAMAIYIIMVMIASFITVKYRNPGIIDWGIVLFSMAAAWVMM